MNILDIKVKKLANWCNVLNVESEPIELIIESSSQLSYRDQAAIRQFHRALCVAIDLAANSKFWTGTVAEIGSGFTASLLRRFAERGLISEIHTIDANSNSLSINSRGVLRDSYLGKTSGSYLLEFHKFVTTSIEDVNRLYSRSALSELGVDDPWQALPRFMNLNFDSRNFLHLSSHITEFGTLKFESDFNNLLDTPIYKYFLECNSEERKMLIHAPKNSLEQFQSLLVSKNPDILILDGGEISALSDFLTAYPLMKPGSIIILHDIIFPKSIKNWLSTHILLGLDNWRVIDLDFSTAQGICFAVKNN